MEKRDLQIYFIGSIIIVVTIVVIVTRLLPWIREIVRIAREKREILTSLQSESHSANEEDLSRGSPTQHKPVRMNDSRKKRSLPNYNLTVKRVDESSHRIASSVDSDKAPSHDSSGENKPHSSGLRRRYVSSAQSNHLPDKTVHENKPSSHSTRTSHAISSNLTYAPPRTSALSSSSYMSDRQLRAVQDLEYEVALRKDEEEAERKQSYERRIEALRKDFLSEPQESDEAVLTICFRVNRSDNSQEKAKKSKPDVLQVKRRFLSTDKAGRLLDFVESLDFQCEARNSNRICSFEIFCFSPRPLRLRRDLSLPGARETEKEDMTQADLGIVSNSAFSVKFDDA